LKNQGRKENAAQATINLAFYGALFGKCQPARENAKVALGLVRSAFAIGNAALVAAMCGDESQAQSLIDEMSSRFPSSTEIKAIGLPLVRSELERERGHIDEALKISESIRSYDLGVIAGCANTYFRGTLYLQQRRGNEAAAEFKRIIDNPGVDVHSPFHVLAHLGLARAAEISGDTPAARKSYQDFFALWKDADPDLPILVEATKEYQKLK
jgi:tetratricopeptide (TPR) repeat protein